MQPLRWSGLDLQLGLALGATLALTGLGFGFAQWVGAGLGLALAVPVVGLTWQLTVDAQGVVLRRKVLGLMPWSTQRFPLDVNASLFQSLEADAPEGVCLEPPRCLQLAQSESDVFGPLRVAAIERLYAEVQAAILEARAPLQPRLELQSPLFDVTAVRVTRSGVHGAATEAVAERALQLCGANVVAGATLSLNGDDWLDPRRDDAVQSITLPRSLTGSPRMLGHPVVRGGAVVWLHGGDRVRSVTGAFGDVALDGFMLDGAKAVGFDEQGEPSRGVLAKAVARAGLQLPAGSEVSRWKPALLGEWSVRLAGPVECDGVQLEAGDTVWLARGGQRVQSLSPRAPRPGAEGEVPAGYVPMTRSGRVDWRTVRRLAGR